MIQSFKMKDLLERDIIYMHKNNNIIMENIISVKDILMKLLMVMLMMIKKFKMSMILMIPSFKMKDLLERDIICMLKSNNIIMENIILLKENQMNWLTVMQLTIKKFKMRKTEKMTLFKMKDSQARDIIYMLKRRENQDKIVSEAIL